VGAVGLQIVHRAGQRRRHPPPHDDRSAPAPVAALITSGAYRLSRNPMYTGLGIAYLGGGLLADSWWPIARWPLVMLAVARPVIRPEERYLDERFGPAYAAYRARTQRCPAGGSVVSGCRSDTLRVTDRKAHSGHSHGGVGAEGGVAGGPHGSRHGVPERPGWRRVGAAGQIDERVDSDSQNKRSGAVGKDSSTLRRE
jgi:hypothetical protein